MDPAACPDGYRALSTGELRELLQSDDKMEQIIGLNEKFQELQIDREMMMASNRSLADDSLARRPRLNNGRLQLAEKYRELSNVATTCWEKQSQLGAAGHVHGGEHEPGGLFGLLPALPEDLPHAPSAGGENAGLDQEAARQSGRRRGRAGQRPRGGKGGRGGSAAAQRLRGAGTSAGFPGTLRPDAGHPAAALPAFSRFPRGPGTAAAAARQDSPAPSPPAGTRPGPRRPPPAGGAQGDRTAARGLAAQRAPGTAAAALQAQPATTPAAPPIGRRRREGGAKASRRACPGNGDPSEDGKPSVPRWRHAFTRWDSRLDGTRARAPSQSPDPTGLDSVLRPKGLD
ncbi:translation initiation factor IF-2 isoform X1 [Hippocampus comes]|uniref:translation initiation factor IF-2 isoform X1 n=1 Tax=Hippocampus comes TaxID=109280 RepID=UPI00094E2474|nr:PREDICTED: translation initiation factor IF-2-like isoform X1 [Hippocampus comes]